MTKELYRILFGNVVEETGKGVAIASKGIIIVAKK